MHGAVRGRLPKMVKPFFHLPVDEQHRAAGTRLHDRTRHPLLLASARGVDDDSLVASFDGKLRRAHKPCLAANADQRRIQRMIGDQPQSAADTEHVGALVAVETEGVVLAQGAAPSRWRSVAGIRVSAPSNLC
jgi:hypothetical protein